MNEYSTREFGTITVAPDEELVFSQPPFGFEQCKRFCLLQDSEIGNHIAWLQSLDDPDLCFVLFDPSGLAPYYAPVLPDNIDELVGDGQLECWVIAVVPQDFLDTTVNLKSPIILNVHRRRGAQIILNQEYPVRFPLMKGES